MSTTEDNVPASDATNSLSYATPVAADPKSDRLTRGDVACLAVKLIGLYCLVRMISHLAEYLGYIRTSAFQIAPIAPVILFGGAGIFLFVFGEGISRWLLPRTAVVTTEPPGHAPAQIRANAFSVVGLVLFVESAPYLAWLLMQLFLSDNGQSIRHTTLSAFSAASALLIRYGSETVLGLWLFFGSKRLSAWWWGLRHPEFRDDSGQT